MALGQNACGQARFARRFVAAGPGRIEIVSYVASGIVSQVSDERPCERVCGTGLLDGCGVPPADEQMVIGRKRGEPGPMEHHRAP